MTPEEIKSRIQGAYTRAIANPSLQRYHSSNLTDLFRDLRLYGQDAGTDFIETHIDRIVKEAVDEAECKRPSLQIPAYTCGLAAIEAMANTLRIVTAMNVELTGNVIRLTWADTNPRLM